MVHPNTSPWKILENRERGRIQRRPNFFEYPYYLMNGYSYELQIWQVYSIIHRVHPNKSSLKIWNLGEKGAWAYPGTVELFEYPLLSQERVKLQTSNFVRTFLVSIGTKIDDRLKKSCYSLSTLATIYKTALNFTPKPATVAEIGDKLSPKSTTVVSSVDRA